MKRTQGQLDATLQRRQQAGQELGQRPLAQVASVADLKALLKPLMDYLQVPYREV